MDDLITTPSETAEDPIVETSLRPKTFAQYIGQDGIKNNLQILIQAAKER
jgi:holliday junction DNA helicase RuvB